MARLPNSNFLAVIGLILLTVAALGAAGSSGKARFSRLIVDFGIVCSDVDASARFYTDVLGGKEIKGFSVPGKVLGKAGLTDYQDADIRVIVLGDKKEATRIKLMQFEGAPGVHADQNFVHSTYGVSYITVFVTDIDAALARAKKYGVLPLAEGPAAIGDGRFLALIKDPDGNFVELVGPKSK